MVFTIDQVYKGGVPRGQYHRSPIVKLENGEEAGLTVSPTTSPQQWVLLAEKLIIVPSVPTMTGTGSGMLKMEYPDYIGGSKVTYLFDDLAAIQEFADEINSINSNTQYVINFHPPILLKASKDESDLVVGLPTDRTIDSGDISFLVTGWTIKEEDYD